MGISWREVLGLLIGLAVCYGVISYALTSAQERETASKQAQESTQQETTDQRTTPAADENTKALTLRVGGRTDQPFGANFGNLSSSRSVEGRAPADYEVRINTDPGSGDYITATAWKTTGDSN